jgi:DNA-binding MarR family transcriptional regulator
MTREAANVVRTNIEDAEWVERLCQVIDEFRKVNQDITANQMLIMLRAGERPGITQRELCKLTQLSDGTVSRICAVLSERGHQSRKGLGVLSIHPLPGEYRAKGQTLTSTGNRIFNTIRTFMTGKFKRS